jgi:hypothetical protein
MVIEREKREKVDDGGEAALLYAGRLEKKRWLAAWRGRICTDECER